MDETLIKEFTAKAREQNAEVRMLEGNGLAEALREIARETAAATFSVSADLRKAVAGSLKSIGLKEVELSADIAITSASRAVVETGSLVVEGSRRLFITADVHVAVVSASRIVDGLSDLPSSGAPRPPFTLITGPSRTADIERVLVLGAHGPRRLVVLLAIS